MAYKKNPKTDKSGIVCAIPQTGLCPNKCDDCFFQSGRSYLEPLDENLPNIPPIDMKYLLLRVNDGNDSNVKRDEVMKAVKGFPNRFYNTAIPRYLEKFDGPVVLTINPAKLTDTGFHKLEEIPPNLMFVRIRVNTWNLDNVVKPAVEYYAEREVPIVLTFMAYYTESIPEGHKSFYTFRKRTLNSYWVITKDGWYKICKDFVWNKWVHECGKDINTHACRFCGNCHREYFVALERMREAQLAKAGMSQTELNELNEALQAGAFRAKESPPKEEGNDQKRSV
jgi:hypothetical protein